MFRRFEPSLDDVVQYLQDRPHLIIREKNPYQADRLMMMLDNEKLAALEQEFNEHPNGIELPNFIWLMKCAISHAPEDKYELVNGLIKLFQDIDINGDGHMEWAEFTQYIIDAVIGSKDAQLYDARFERDRELTELEVIDRAYSRKSKRYMPMQQADYSNHKSIIKNIAYSAYTDSVICLEQNSSYLKFYTTDVQERKFALMPPQDEGRTFIIHFSVHENIIAAVTSDRQFFFFDNSATNQRILKSFKQDVLQTGIWYFPYHQMWVTAGADYNIRAWDIQMNDKDSPGRVIKFLGAHMKPITDIVELVSPKMVASASHDGKIKLWDMQDQKLITELKSPYPSNRGVMGLSYNRDYGSNLLSFGFENHINVWCPEVSITRAYIGKLEGHSNLVVACKFIPISPNCISIDDRTNIRIWDIRTMSSVQVLPNDQVAFVTDICIIHKTDQFVYCGKRLNYFQNASNMPALNQKQKGPNEEVYPISVEFNLYYNIFVVLTKLDVRIYDAMSGKLKRVLNELYDDKLQIDLSNTCFGGRQRKFFISDNGGMIRQYNMKSGEFLKKVNMHNEIEKSEFANKLANIKKRDTVDISGIVFLHEEKLLISTSLDSTIRIYDETDPEESILLKVICGGHQNSEIITMSYSLHFTMLATGSGNGLISLWDFDSGKLIGVLVGLQSEVLSIDFSDPYPILVSAQATIVSVWNIKTNKCLLRINTLNPLTCVATFSDHSIGVNRHEPFPEYAGVYITPEKKSKLNIQDELDGITKDQSAYDGDLRNVKRRLLVYIGDTKGVIHSITLTEYLQRKGITEMEKQRKGLSFQLKRKDLIDASKSVDTFITQEEKSPYSVLTVNLNAVLIRQWNAHTASITKLNKIRDPISHVSSSLDKHFKIWSMKGDLWADINLSRQDGNNLWQFPYDWVGQKLKDIELVFDALKIIEKENLNPEQREQVKVRFLMNKYFNENAEEDLFKLTSHVVPEVQVVQKEKKRIVQSQSQQMNLAHKPVGEQLRDINQKIRDEQLMKKKMELPDIPDDPALRRPQSQSMGLVQKLMAAFSDQRDQPQVEESVGKKKQKAQHKRELPAVKPISQGGNRMSQERFVKNQKFVETMVNQRPITEQSRFKFVNDIKYQSGESMRAMKMTTYKNFLKFQSMSPQLLCDDNEILQMKCQFYKKLNEANKEVDLDDEEEYLEEEEKQQRKKDMKIVASQNFLNNASKNKHKVLKTKNKIFVV